MIILGWNVCFNVATSFALTITIVGLALDESEITLADEAVLAGGFGRADLGGSVAGNLWHKWAVLVGNVVVLLCAVVRQTVDFTG